jgi:hypothetical protein
MNADKKEEDREENKESAFPPPYPSPAFSTGGEDSKAETVNRVA